MKPAAYDRQLVFAFRALFEGTANDHQQKRAMEWLLLNACHIGQPSFAPTDRETAFLEGERHIGLQIARLRDDDALKLITGSPRRKTEAKEARE